MRTRMIYVIFLFFFILNLKVFSKKNINIPISHNRLINNNIKNVQELEFYKFSNLDLNEIKRKDSVYYSDGVGKPFRFGETRKVNLDFKSISTYEEIEGVGHLWRLRIECDNATCFNLNFKKNSNKKNIKLNIFKIDDTLNSFSKNIENYTSFSTGIIAGNDIIIEYFEKEKLEHINPVLVKITIGYLEINEIFGLKNPFNSIQSNLYSIDPGSNSIAPCHKDVNCSEGDDYCREKYSIGYIVFDEFLCTGSLLNNQKHDYTPYFLTAFHCLDIGDASLPFIDPYDFLNGALSDVEKEQIEDWVVYFGVKKSGCGTGSSEPYFSYNGAEFKAGWVISDFALVELLEQPEPGETNFNDVFYSGWDRTSSLPDLSVGIHHPRGNFMKISVDYDEANDLSWWSSPYPQNTHIRVEFDVGTVQHGSSGSPLFNQNNKIVGQLHGNRNYYNGMDFCETRIGDYGKLSLSWNGDGTPTTRLKDWLDPDDTGVEVLDGIYTSNLQFGESTNYGQTRHEYAHSDYVVGSSQSSSYVVESGANLTLQAGREVVIKPCTYIKAGSEFRAFIQQPDCDDNIWISDKWSKHNPNICNSYPKNVFAEFEDEIPLILNSKLTLSPNPTSGNTIATVEIGEKSICSLTLMDNLGNEVVTIFKDKELDPGKYQYDLEANNLSNGVYLCVLRIGSSMHSEKLVYLK